MRMERTLVIVKPDGVQRGLIGPLLSRLEARGLKIVGLKLVQVVRNSVGATNPLHATPGTVRGDLALDIGRNLIHASDAPATAERELALWFGEGELVGYAREVDRWIFE